MQPIGDLFKTQVRELAVALDLPESVRTKAPSADLWAGQTDEGELGFTYADVDQVLFLLVDERYTVDEVVEEGFDRAFVEDVWRRVKINHYKRTMPNIAKVSRRSYRSRLPLSARLHLTAALRVRAEPSSALFSPQIRP